MPAQCDHRGTANLREKGSEIVKRLGLALGAVIVVVVVLLEADIKDLVPRRR